MSGHCNTYIQTGLFLNLLCDLIGNGRIFVICHFLFVFFLGERRVFFGNSAFRHCQDRELATPLGTFVNGLHNLFDIIRNLRDQDNIRPARHTRVQRQIADLMAHNLHNKYPAVGSRCGMYAIDAVCCDIHRTLKTKRHIRTPKVIINSLRQRHDIQAFLTQHICCLMGTVTTQDHKAVQTKLIVILLHSLNLVQTVLIRLSH